MAYDKVAALRALAAQSREVATQISDKVAAAGLVRYAEECEAQATDLETLPTLPPAAAIPSGEPPVARSGAALKPEVVPHPEQAPDPKSPKS